MSSRWKGDSCPVRVVVLGGAQVRSPPCDMCDCKPLVLEHPHVLIGRVPDAESVICMVDEVHLPFVGQSGCRQERWRHGNGCQHCFALNIWELGKDGLPYHTRIGACTVPSNEQGAHHVAC